MGKNDGGGGSNNNNIHHCFIFVFILKNLEAEYLSLDF